MNNSYNWEIFQQYQTPKVPEIDLSSLDSKIEVYTEFLNFTKKLSPAGLAANQVSLNGEPFNERLFAMTLDHRIGFELILNPKIIATHGDFYHSYEGCYSWKGIDLCGIRYPVIDVEYYDIKGNKHELSMSVARNRVFQHELNHLDGIREMRWGELPKEQIKRLGNYEHDDYENYLIDLHTEECEKLFRKKGKVVKKNNTPTE